MSTSMNPARPFGSVSVAMVTPFHEDGSLDIDSALVVAHKLVSDGCDALVLSGTTGESPTTNQKEKDTLIREVKAAVGDRVMLIAGAGSNDTAHCVDMARASMEAGADGLLVVSPYYNRPSQEGLFQHFRAVAEATDLPVLLYDIPGRTGVTIQLDTLKRIAELPTVKGVKDATGDVHAGVTRMDATGLAWYSGDDALNYSWLAHGAVGVVSVAGHVISSRLRMLIDLMDAGDYAAARKEIAGQMPVITAIMGGGQGAVMAKEALTIMGVLPTATLRLPLVGACATERNMLRDVLAAEGLLS